jgi:rhodanese-related sulfurtransferase
MTPWLAHLTLNQKLALAALGLGVAAPLAKVAPDRAVVVHETALLTTVERQEDHVTPSELAAWVIEGRSDYRLIDLRDAGAFGEYHIPTAENVPLPTLPEAALLRNEKIVLYSDGGIHAVQAWMLLRGKGYPGSYTLLGDLAAWKEEVLFPPLPKDASPQQQARFERAATVARFFGGSPRTEGAAAADQTPNELPKVAAPPPAAAGGAAPAPRKKREGC